MKFREREEIVLGILQRQQTVKAEELSQKLGVSLVTVRKDLQRLDDEGKLVRTFGGAAACTVDRREQHRFGCAQAIADWAAKEIREGDCVILNAGTTTMLTAQNLRRHRKLKVITNATSVAREMSRHDETQVVLLGGELAGDAFFTYGSETIEQLKQYQADKLILSVSGISCGRGITTRHMEAADLFRRMIEQSEEVIVVADETKIGFESFYHVSDLKVVDKIITNKNPENESELKEMEKQGIHICRC